MLSPWRLIHAEDHAYRVIQFIGSGGNAETYHVIREKRPEEADDAEDHGVGANYALKMAHRGLSAERLDRFERERDFLEDADHPLILPHHDNGQFNESPFMVIEYLPNTLKDLIRSDRSSIPERVNYATQLTSALVYLHSLDEPVIHRDIKPANIFVRQNTCFLGDFGLMKQGDSGGEEDVGEMFKESKENAMPYRYPTPELVNYESGNSLAPSSDVFQLGIVLTELFTSYDQNPIQDVDTRDDLDPIEVEDINNVPGTVVSEDIRSILERMTGVDADDRPSAEELLPEWLDILQEATEAGRRLNGKVL